MGAALVEHGPDLIDSFVPGEALLQRLEAFHCASQALRAGRRLREIDRPRQRKVPLLHSPTYSPR